MRITIVGCGAVGAVVAAVYRSKGIETEIVSRNPAIVEALARDGIRLTGALGNRSVPARAAPVLSSDLPPRRLVLLATKANDCVTAAEQIKKVLADDGIVVALQNGIVLPDLISVLGAERVAGGVVNWGSSLVAPGQVAVTARGYMVLGSRSERLQERLKPVAQVMSEVFPTRVTDNIDGALWSKLVVNAGFNPICALLDCSLGSLLTTDEMLTPAFRSMRESISVAETQGVRLEKIFGQDLPKAVVPTAADLGFARRFALRLIGIRMRNVRPSLLQSLANGRATEIQHINGRVVTEGRRVGIATEMNARLVELIHEVEMGKRRLGRQNLADLQQPSAAMAATG